jgi:hypothetical protein
MFPLLRELNIRLSGKTNIAIGRTINLPNTQVGRILNGSVSPTWMDMTRLILESGLTPDDAVRIAGLSVTSEYDTAGLSNDERDLIEILRDPAVAPVRDNILLVARSLADKGRRLTAVEHHSAIDDMVLSAANQ